MKKILLFVAFAALAGGNVGLLAQPAPGEDEDPPNGPVIVDEDGPGIDPAVLQDFNENFAPWLQPPGLSIEGLPEPIGFELWKTGGGPELVQTFSNELGAWQAAERAEAEAFSKRTGLPLIWRNLHQEKTPPWSHEFSPIYESFGIMIGVEDGLPVYLSFLNAGAADTIGTDELWTTNRTLLNGLSGLNLNGEGTQLAMWDGGDVLFTHREFATNRFTDSNFTDEFRVFNEHQMTFDGRATNYVPHGHATHVAGILTATGMDNHARGMSPGATLLAFNFTNDFTEMTAAFADANNHFRISNHSYGHHFGWAGSITNEVDDMEYPFWHGRTNLSTIEDYRFGYYDIHALEMDEIIWWSRYYLPVWSAGNDRGKMDGDPHLDPRRGYYTWRPVGGKIENILITNNVPPPPPADYAVDGGYDLLTSRAVAKNNLVVGSVHKIPGGYGALSTNVVTTTNVTTAPNDMMITNTVTTINVIVNTNVVMSAFSSWGPTDDGRIKPDIVAPGEGLYTSSTNAINLANMTYRTAYGTSMAAPTVAGSLNLLVQLHRRQVGTNQPMLASTLRALAIHTADEAGDHPGPDYRFGWGLFNALSAANLMTNNFHSDSLAHIKEVPLVNGTFTNAYKNYLTIGNDSIYFPVVAKGGEPLKVTLCWTDPVSRFISTPGLDPTNRRLINDLDLHLHDSRSTNGHYRNFYPWVLDLANPAREARRGFNNRDNVEQVVINNPDTNNVYMVRVDSHLRKRKDLAFPPRPLLGSSMVYNNTTALTNQWVSLLISGNAPQPEPALEITDDLSEPHFISLRWPSVVGRVYQVQCQTNLLSSQGWLPASGEIAATRTNTAVRLPLLHTNAPSCFYRIRRLR